MYRCSVLNVHYITNYTNKILTERETETERETGPGPGRGGVPRRREGASFLSNFFVFVFFVAMRRSGGGDSGGGQKAVL